MASPVGINGGTLEGWGAIVAFKVATVAEDGLVQGRTALGMVFVVVELVVLVLNMAAALGVDAVVRLVIVAALVVLLSSAIAATFELNSPVFLSFSQIVRVQSAVAMARSGVIIPRIRCL